MTERQKRNRAFIVLAAALTITAASGFYFSRRQPMQAQTVAQPAQTNTPRGTRIYPKVTLLDEPEWREKVSLEVLGRESKAIIVGKPIRTVTRQSENGKEVSIHFDVQVQEAIKGDLQPNSMITVTMPGGLIREADGTLREFRTPHMRKMSIGKIYALFLKAKNPNDNVFTPLRGSQGIYEIPANGTRVIHLGFSINLPPPDDEPEINDFLRTIRAMRNDR